MYLSKVVYNDTIASGAATSTGISLQRAWAQIGVAVSTMSTSAAIALQMSTDGGTTFFPVFVPVPNTSSVQANAFSIASGVGISSGFVPLPCAIPHIRFVTTGVVSGGVSFKIVCQSD